MPVSEGQRTSSARAILLSSFLWDRFETVSGLAAHRILTCKRMAEHPVEARDAGGQRTLDLLFAVLQTLHGNFGQPETKSQIALK